MIDWPVKVVELKQTADELDLWAAKSEGRQRSALGRIADELRRFAGDVEALLKTPEARTAEEVPDWLIGVFTPPADSEEAEGGESPPGDEGADWQQSEDWQEGGNP